jgi:hypothetical protein
LSALLQSPIDCALEFIGREVRIASALALS